MLCQVTAEALQLTGPFVPPIFQNSIFLLDHQCQQCGLASLFLPEIPTSHSSVSSFHPETPELHRWVAELSGFY